jgi:hypothetical protein
MDHVEGLPGFGHGTSTDQKGVTTEWIAAEWLGLSPDVSVVAYRFDGDFIGWQTPVSGVASLQPDTLPQEVEFAAFDVSGREVERFGPIALEPIPEDAQVETLPGNVTVIEDWAPTTDGVEIQEAELSTSLAEAIEPQAGDRFFSIAAEAGEVVILVRDTTTHAYAETCEALASLDLPPGMGGTCLD